MTVWIRYRPKPEAEHVDARFHEKPDAAVMASFLNECATRLGLKVDEGVDLAHAAIIEERRKRELPTHSRPR